MKPAILFVFLLIFISCLRNPDINSKIAVNFNSSAYYPKLTDTSEFEIFDYFDQNQIERYIAEINNFKTENCSFIEDSNYVLFVGSSSIRMWKSLSDDFKPLNALNRGFGGATIPEVIYFYDEIFSDLNPKSIVFYCGENDHYYNSSSEIYTTFQYFEQKVHSKLPETELFFVSIKPSPSRKKLWKQMSLTNRFISHYCSLTENTEYIDVASKMFNSDFSINENLFEDDDLHLNSDGYALWTSIIKPEIEN